MSTDALVVLKNDHREVEKLFKQFEKKNTTTANKGKIVESVIELLTVHTYIENEILYPEVRDLVPDLEDHILESYEEHHVADVLVMELAQMKAGDERFEAKFKVLMENVRHHVKEEEDEWFPQVREALSRTQLQEMGQRLLEAKETAPRRPEQPSAMKKTIDAIIS